MRGHGKPPLIIKKRLSKPQIQRKQWINRVIRDLDDLTNAMNKAIKEENPNWGIVKYEAIPGTSLRRYIEGEKHMFKTPYGGVSGAEERKEEVPESYLSDVDVYIYFTPGTDIWYKGNLSMHAENKIIKNPGKYLRRHRNFSCINFRGNKITGQACNDPFRLPLDEKDFRKTHEVVEHMKK